MFNGTLKVGNEYELNNGEVWECGVRGGVHTLDGCFYENYGAFRGHLLGHPLSVRQCVKGTLADIGVKPGDVVKWNDKNYTAFHKPKPDGASGWWAGNVDSGWIDAYTSGVKLISHASDTPTLFRDMTDAEKGALLLAAHEGEAIQMWFQDGTWIDVDDPDFAPSVAYRIKPEPTTETRTLYMGADLKNALKYGSDNDAYKLHYDIIDGKPCNPSFEAVG